MKASKSKLLKNNKHMLLVLKSAKPQLRKAILKNAPEELIKALFEICYNLLKGNYPVPPAKRGTLHKYKNPMRIVGSPQKSLKVKRKTLVQKGGFLPVLLSTIGSLLISELFR